MWQANTASVHQGVRVSERLSSTAFLWTPDIGVHVIHKSLVTIAYTLESLPSLTYIIHNLQATIYFKKKDIKKEIQELTEPIKLTYHWR